MEGRGLEENEERSLSRSSSEEGGKPGEPGVPKERGSKRKEGGAQLEPHVTVNMGHRGVNSKTPRRNTGQMRMLDMPLDKRASLSRKSKAEENGRGAGGK